MLELTQTTFGKEPLVDTRDMDEAREAIGRIFCPHFLSVGRMQKSDFRARCSVLEEPGYSVSHVSYAADTDIDPGELSDFYLLLFPLHGKASIRSGKQDVQTLVGQTASVLSPTVATRMAWRDRCEQLVLLLRREAIEQYFETLTHRKAEPVEFDPTIDLTSDLGMGIARHVSLMLSAASLSHKLPASYRIALRDGLVNLLLTSLSHNRTEALTPPTHNSLPAAVRKAEAFIQANFDRPISSSDIAQAAGVPLRTLQSCFYKAKGMTLVQAIQTVRLDRLRAMLSKPSDDISVADAMYACGLGHLGRVAAAYRSRYGESPSQTLRQSLAAQ